MLYYLNLLSQILILLIFPDSLVTFISRKAVVYPFTFKTPQWRVGGATLCRIISVLGVKMWVICVPF